MNTSTFLSGLAILLTFGGVGCSSSGGAAAGGGGSASASTGASAGDGGGTTSSNGGASASGGSGGSGAGGTSASSGGGGAASAPRLSVKDAQILDPDGNEVVLRGWNWGQQESIKSTDADDNAREGATVVRIPIRWWGPYPDDQDTEIDEAPYVDKAWIEQVAGWVEALGQHGIWVDIFVDSDCGQGSTSKDTVANCGAAADGSPKNLINDAEKKRRFMAAWAYIAERFADVKFVGMYEVLSEPNFTCAESRCDDWSVTPKFYESVIPTIRAKDPRTPIIVGAAATYDMKKLDTALLDRSLTNIVYTGDILSHGASEPDVLTPALAFRDKNHVPLFIQQVGVQKRDDASAASLDRTLKNLGDAKIGWTWWTYREPNDKTGTGFAPVYHTPNGWKTDACWMKKVTGYFPEGGNGDACTDFVH